EKGVGFSKGVAEFVLKNPPPFVPSCLMAICEAAGPTAMTCSVTLTGLVFGWPLASRTGLPLASGTGSSYEVGCRSVAVRDGGRGGTTPRGARGRGDTME